MAKKLTEFEKKFGEVCGVCGLRKGTFFTSGHNLPKGNSTCQCDGIVSTTKKPFVNKDATFIIEENKRIREKQITDTKNKTEEATGMIMEHLSDRGYSQGEADYRAEIIRREVFRR